MTPYVTYGLGVRLIALSIIVGGLYWLPGIVLIVVASEVRAKRERDRAVNEMRDRARRQMHRMYGE